MIWLIFVFLLLTALLYHLTTRFSKRTYNDVFPFLLSVDAEVLYGTFHPEAEEHFRSIHSPEEFRKVQWKRIHLALHYCKKISNNAGIFLGWMRYERAENWRALDPVLREEVLSLRDLSIQCLHSSLVMRLTLRWWLVRMAIAPFAQPPTFATLIRLGSADMISFYDNAKALAENFSYIYGEDYHQKLIQAL